jgi:hypothetical protein
MFVFYKDDYLLSFLFQKIDSFYRKRRWTACFILLVVTLVPAFMSHLNRAYELYHDAETCEKWEASQYWITAAQTYKDTGIWLVCQDASGKIVPYDQFAYADDIGHALFLSLIGKTFNVDFTPLKIIYFNAYLNLFGILLALAFFFKLRFDYIFATILFIAVYYFIFVQGYYSPHYAGLGMVSFISITPFSLLAFRYGWCHKRSALLFAISGVFLLACATLMRSVFGYFGVVTGLSILIYMMVKKWKNFKHVSTYFVLAVAIIFAWLSPKWTLMIRDKIFSVNQEYNPYEKSIWEGPHGISHNLFIGLGIVPNKWGIEYEDLSGYEFAKRVDPSVAYASNQHFKILKNLYFQYIKEDPLEILRIYYEKIKMMLKYPPLLISFLIFPIFCFSFFLKTSLTRRKELPLFLLSTVGVLFFFLQGLLAHPGRYYIGPAIFFSCIQCGILLHYFSRMIKMRHQNTLQIESC